MARKHYVVSDKDNFRRYEEKRLEYHKYSTEEANRNTAFLKQSRGLSKLPKKPPLKFKGGF